jgi:hypothetical protein
MQSLVRKNLLEVVPEQKVAEVHAENDMVKMPAA